MVIADACFIATYSECTGAHKPNGGLTGDLLTWAEGHYYVHDHASLAATYTSKDRLGGTDGKEGALQLYQKVFGVRTSNRGSFINLMQRIKNVHDGEVPWHGRGGIQKIRSYDVKKA